MKTNFQDVQDFHAKYLVPCSATPALLDPTTQEYREKFLAEELKELTDCYVVGDLEGVADALVDLVYVAMGTAIIMGLPWERLWGNVQQANMNKRLAKPDGSDSKRGSPMDVVKPPGWVGPDHKEALGLSEGVISIFNAHAEMDARAKSRIVAKPGQVHTIGANWTPVKLVWVGTSMWMVHEGQYVTQVEVTEELRKLFGERASLWFLVRSVNGVLTLGHNIPAPKPDTPWAPSC